VVTPPLVFILSLVNLMRPSFLASIHHDGSSRYVSAGAHDEPRLGEQVTLRLRAGRDAPIQRVLVRTCPDGEQHFDEMRPAGEATACRWWEAALPVNMPAVNYRFLVFTTEGAWWYNGAGLHRHVPTDANDFRLLAGYHGPRWLRDSVFYQILPDRFADGDPASNVRDGEWTYREYRSIARAWGQPPSAGWEALTEFYGGDLPGITQRLDHLSGPREALGVNALYLNPIFTSYSNHRYDVVDYDQVDPHLGGNAALVALRQALSDRGMQYILDMVPNHCGVLHPWFRAAQADASAPTAAYFTFTNHPSEYASWLGHKSLPKLNYRSRALRDAMYAGPDAIFRRWLRPPYAADGWRIDVANMLARQGADQLGVEIGQGIRQAVKAENSEAYLLGENFFDATGQLQGDCWDAAMNYSGFTQPLWHWLKGFSAGSHGMPEVSAVGPWPTQALVDSWTAFRAAIPWQIARQQFNLVDSHDTPRIRTIVRDDLGLVRLAAGMLFTYPGVPCIYYGDEIGLGARPADARACMPWERTAWDEDLLGCFRTLVRLRRTSPALIDGGFQVLAVEEDSLAYQRDTDAEQIVVVAHRGPGVRPARPLPVAHGSIPDGVGFTDLLTGHRATVVDGHLPSPAMPPGIAIWQSDRHSRG
jgi:alpha-glucosidase